MRRAGDVILACVLLVLTAPLMAFVALAIKLDSPGPVTCRAAGVWLDGRRRTGLLKFRTTRYEAGSSARGTPRTRVGRYLCRIGLDELPVLFQVLRGDLSIFNAVTRPPSTNKRGS
jgi:lipopolysaccharide/colanic/teichoic acid biosynthesis glycosyltransferase